MQPSDADYDFGARVAAGYTRPGLDIEDLRQIGRIAIWKAAEQFDPSRGVPWHAWAWRWASMAAHSYARRPMHEVQFGVDCDVEQPETQPDQSLDLLLPCVARLPLQVRVILLLLMCGCTAREVAWRLERRYADVLEMRRSTLNSLRAQIEMRGIHYV